VKRKGTIIRSLVSKKSQMGSWSKDGPGGVIRGHIKSPRTHENRLSDIIKVVLVIIDAKCACPLYPGEKGSEGQKKKGGVGFGSPLEKCAHERGERTEGTSWVGGGSRPDRGQGISNHPSVVRGRAGISGP